MKSNKSKSYSLNRLFVVAAILAGVHLFGNAQSPQQAKPPEAASGTKSTEKKGVAAPSGADANANAKPVAAPKPKPKPQTIKIVKKPDLKIDSTGVFEATGGASGSQLKISLSPSSVCTASPPDYIGSPSNLVVVINGLSKGTCVIQLTQDGNDAFLAATAIQDSIVIKPLPQAISFKKPADLTVGKSEEINATGGASRSPVTFSSLTSDTCTISTANGKNSVDGIKAGKCTIAADQTGDDKYEPAVQVQEVVQITKAAQSVNIPSLSSLTVASSEPINAKASSGLPVSYTTNDSSVCIAGVDDAGIATITAVKVGDCKITAKQVGNDSYDEGSSTVTIVVNGATSVSGFFNGWGVGLAAMKNATTIYSGGTISGSGASSIVHASNVQSTYPEIVFAKHFYIPNSDGSDCNRRSRVSPLTEIGDLIGHPCYGSAVIGGINTATAGAPSIIDMVGFALVLGWDSDRKKRSFRHFRG